MTIEKDKLAEVLLKLDSKNDQHWTDDGLPRVNVVQELANDTSITRAQINDAAPGFARKVEGDEPEVEAKTVVEAGQDEADGFDDRMEPEVNGPGAPLSDAEVEAILKRRVSDAEIRMHEARAAISRANEEYVRAQKRVDRARADLNRRFPPMDASDAIKAHLEAQQRLLMERVTGNAGANGREQVDIAMGQSNRRGWTRPARPVQNVA